MMQRLTTLSGKLGRRDVGSSTATSGKVGHRRGIENWGEELKEPL